VLVHVDHDQIGHEPLEAQLLLAIEWHAHRGHAVQLRRERDLRRDGRHAGQR
jgi:hypothetical protein